jgi:hypothetical protein
MMTWLSRTIAQSLRLPKKRKVALVDVVDAAEENEATATELIQRIAQTLRLKMNPMMEQVRLSAIRRFLLGKKPLAHW